MGLMNSKIKIILIPIVLLSGSFPERSNGTDLRSVGNAFVGSSPTRSKTHFTTTSSECLYNLLLQRYLS